MSIPAVVSGRFFDDTTCIPEKKIEYEQSFPSCLNAYMKAGFISPKDSNPVKILKPSKTSTRDCEFENLFEQTAKCPKVWQYRLWSFQTGGIKLERFLPKNQHTQRKLLNFENWIMGSKIGHHFRK